MELYVEKETAGVYGLIDTFIDETINLTTKTVYTQDITAIYKGFTNSFAVKATPNNIKLMGYFGYTDILDTKPIKKRAKLYLKGVFFKQGIITLESTSLINGLPSLFQLEFSDGQKNLAELVGEDTLANLSDGVTDGDVVWSSLNIENSLQNIQTASGGQRWFTPLVSTERIFAIDGTALATDNIAYFVGKSISSENVLLRQEIRPAMFISDILKRINTKYDVNINPNPYELVKNTTQLTDLCVMCMNQTAIIPVKATIDDANWDYDDFRRERFNIIPKPLIDAFELIYLGYGGGGRHDATFDMFIQLSKTPGTIFIPSIISGLPATVVGDVDANGRNIYNLEVWEVDALGVKKKKLKYEINQGAESGSSFLRIRIGLEVFTPDGSNEPSTLVKPLVSIYVATDEQAEWKFTNVAFNWADERWKVIQINNVQPVVSATKVNLFQTLPIMKVIDFVKSIYTMYGYKTFTDPKENVDTVNDFFYTKKTANGVVHSVLKEEIDLTPYADLSKLTKNANTRYDAYQLKHVTSAYQQNIAFNLANGQEYGALKYPNTGKPKNEFKIETKFTTPVFNPMKTTADTQVFTFYPFGSEPKLNDLETRFIFDTNTKEFPIFYYNGQANISTPYAFVDTKNKVLKSISKYHKISHKSSNIFTETDNYITSLFNIISGDYIDQNTLYVQAYKKYIDGTITGDKLIHTIELELPYKVITENFKDSKDVIIKETKYSILESEISLSNGKTKLKLLNK